MVECCVELVKCRVELVESVVEPVELTQYCVLWSWWSGVDTVLWSWYMPYCCTPLQQLP